MKRFWQATLWLALPLLLLTASGMSSAASLPSFAEVQHSFQLSEATLLDRHDEPIQQLRINLQERRLPWVALDDISPALRTALVLSEDRRFYQHSGIDWNAVAAAAWSNLWNTKTRGASTLTMQLAGLLDADLRRRAAPRSFVQKISQAMVAQELERNWRKDQILEAYLNLVSFRGELVGVHALSRVLFQKHPSGLNRREAAIAVALVRAPNAQPARVAKRACAILKEQRAAQECMGLDGITYSTLARLHSRSSLENMASGAIKSPHLAPHLAQRMLQHPNQTLRSTLDATTQRFVRDAIRRQLAALAQRNIEDSAVLVLDNASGDVLAWVGSSGDFSEARHVDGVLALRQAGSTLKPFLYELAIEKKWLTAASILDDAPLNLATATGLYIPQNYDHQYKGLVSLRTALGSSLNIPAVRTLVTVTPERLFRRMQALGFGLRESGDYYGYSLALGSADVSLLALTNAYRALANHGNYSQVRTRIDAPASKQQAVMDPAASFIITNILSDRSARARTFGLENALSGRVGAAVKTGTSKDMRDNWCIGYSDRYTVGVWVGNASGAPMWDVSGVTGAAPIWQEVMQFLHGRLPTSKPKTLTTIGLPTGVVSRQITYQPQVETTRRELFLVGTEQSVITVVPTAQMGASIRYPTNGMLVALDPDIPSTHQRIRFAAQGASGVNAWLLDGKRLPSGTIKNGDLIYDWPPWPGRHHLTLVGRNNAVLDQVRFEVRGAIEKLTKAPAKPARRVLTK